MESKPIVKTEDNHDELVISNVEFCMMQFYRSQSDAAKRRLDDTTKTLEISQRDLKRVKRENAHNISLVRYTQNQLLESRLNLQSMTETCENLRTILNHKSEQLYYERRQSDASNNANMRLMELVARIMEDNPQLDDQYDYSSIAYDITHERMNELFPDEEDTETETEPEFDI